MRIRDLLTELVRVSEKAACLARAVRAEKSLFQLLVQEKTGEEKNKYVPQDLKTLTDVLVQEMAIQDLGDKFPSLSGHIHGEENNTFTNKLGESVTVEVKATVDQTADLLGKVLTGNNQAASLLAGVVHQDTALQMFLDQSELETELPDGSIGIWIDPIDSTSEYVKGMESVCDVSGVYTQGLQSVLVLIGVYDQVTGTPVLGVVNQPFNVQDTDDSWNGYYWWGVSYLGINIHSDLQTPKTCLNASIQDGVRAPSVIVSGREPSSVCNLFSDVYRTVPGHGGGYKIVCVFEQHAVAFVSSRPSGFKWDTCAPHAILLALGGGVSDLRKALEVYNKNKNLPKDELRELISSQTELAYHRPDSDDYTPVTQWANSGGVLAYKDIDTALDLLQRLTNLKI